MAFCENCGHEISDAALACPSCGHPQRRFGGIVLSSGRVEGTAIASLILGIAGFLVCPLVLHILAIILGNQAKAKIAADPSLEGDALAKAGVILGWVGVGVAVAGGVAFLIFALIAAGASWT
jgi:hypothetical protein